MVKPNHGIFLANLPTLACDMHLLILYMPSNCARSFCLFGNQKHVYAAPGCGGAVYAAELAHSLLAAETMRALVSRAVACFAVVVCLRPSSFFGSRAACFTSLTFTVPRPFSIWSFACGSSITGLIAVFSVAREIEYLLVAFPTLHKPKLPSFQGKARKKSCPRNAPNGV